MTRASTIAVLDIGKTNVKLVVFNQTGQVLWQASQPNAPALDGPYPHADVEKIWHFLLSALSEASVRHKIDVIVPATHGATGALVDQNGLVLPIMDYEYEAIGTIEPDYVRLRPPFGKTFSPSLPNGLNLGRQLAFQAAHYPEGFGRAQYLLTYPQYWLWRLTGVLASEITSLGCHTDLWEPENARPSSLAVALGLDRQLPPLQPAWTRAGRVRPGIIAQTGLPAHVEVLCGIHDSNAALLPYLLTRANPFTLISTGTWVILMCVQHSLQHLRAQDDMLANVDALGRPTACARFMGGREYGALAGDCDTIAMPEHIACLIRDDIFALPSFSPHGGPFAHRIGQIVGRLAPDRRSGLASLYCALMCDIILDRLEIRDGEIIVDGIFAGNAAFCGLLAQLRPDQEIRCTHDSAGTARGAALLANWPDCDMTVETTRVSPWTVPGLAAYRRRWALMQ